jgi:MoxR-like ATPase
LSINNLLTRQLFDTYESISTQINIIQKGPESKDQKKDSMKQLRQRYEGELQHYNKIVIDYANSFVANNQLKDHVIKARIGSPTPYGNQPKNYLWSGISIDKDKSFSFQYSWVFQKDKLEVTFCFGSGDFSSARVEPVKKIELQSRMRAIEKLFVVTLAQSQYRSIVEHLLKDEGFFLTTEWLKSDNPNIDSIDGFLNHIREKTGAKAGITRYFTIEELLADGFNLEQELERYFSMFRPIWDELHHNEQAIINEDIVEIQTPVQPVTQAPYDVAEQLLSIQQFIWHKGFTYPDHLIANFYLSLKSKPFVLLAGGSGTGKTKLVKLFAEALGATTENKQFALIPVRPDWSDPSDLLGYKDLSQSFRPGPLTEVLLEASKPENKNKPFFVCLDEMNLARVEHYFSDLLSVLETQEWRADRIMTTPLIHEANLTTEEDRKRYGNLYFPDNVYLIGTVNMDETTHTFSKKVLDRANTIEFNYIRLDQYPDVEEEGDDSTLPSLTNDFLRTEYLQLIDIYPDKKVIIEQTTSELVKINQILEQIHSQVGFRIRDVVCFYLIYNERFQLLDRNVAFDLQLSQKILPRIQGSNSSVRRVLLQLMEIALGKSLPVNELMEDASAIKVEETTKYPQSARKLAFMLRRLEEDGFTSYWLS